MCIRDSDGAAIRGYLPVRAQSRAWRGFTLVEVLVALIIIGVGMLGIAKIQALAYASTGTAALRALAALEASSLAASMRANRGYWSTQAATANPVSYTHLDVYKRQVETSGQSTITAIVRDAQDNLVEGQTVDFQLTDKTGGSISVATAVTNAQGVAQTVYTATSTASGSNGVSVTAAVQGTAIQNTVTLTVGGQTVFLSLGTGATLTENAEKTQFIMPFVIQALDSAGNPVPGAIVTLTIASLPICLLYTSRCV